MPSVCFEGIFFDVLLLQEMCSELKNEYLCNQQIRRNEFLTANKNIRVALNFLIPAQSKQTDKR